MKESGINYFFSGLGLSSSSLAVLYTFEEGAGTIVDSLAVANPLFSGIVANSAHFWDKPGSGFFSGASVAITNASGLSSSAFTHIFSYQKAGGDEMTLLSSLTSQSGYSIGITATNKPYFKTMVNGDPAVAASYNNYSSKNLIAVGYITNHLSISYYNYNAQAFETENFDYAFGAPDSDTWQLGAGFTGFMDYYLYFPEYLSTNTLNSLASGFYNVPTGQIVPVQTICTNTITGYSTITFAVTGITGYNVLPIGFADGVGEFTGVFPSDNVQMPLTGILSTGYYQSGMTGLLCVSYTGTAITAFNVLSGYAAGFGMEKTLLLNFIQAHDIVKYSNSLQPFDDNYNQSTIPMYSGFNAGATYHTGSLDVFFNGIATLASQDWSATGLYLYVSGAKTSDFIFFDLATGIRQSVSGAPYPFVYYGQELFLNGLNILSGFDFTYNGSAINLTNANSGVSGILFDFPVVRNAVTGNFNLFTGSIFSRNTSFVYVNGLRQQNRQDYVEGALVDKLVSNSFNENGNVEVYDNNGDFWE